MVETVTCGLGGVSVIITVDGIRACLTTKR